MIEGLIEIVTPSGRMDAFVTYPEAEEPFPAVVIFMDIWGLREEPFDIARRAATVGYHCTVPNFYYRQGKVRFEFRDERGSYEINGRAFTSGARKDTCTIAFG